MRWLRLLKHPVALWSVALPIQTADCSCSFDEKNPLVERDWGRSVMLWLGLNYSTFFWMYLVHSFPMKKGCRISTMLMNALQEYADHLDLAGKLLTPTFQLAKSTCLPHPPHCYLSGICEQHRGSWEAVPLSMSDNVAKIKLASSTMSSMLKATGLNTNIQRQSSMHHYMYFGRKLLMQFYTCRSQNTQLKNWVFAAKMASF